MADLASTRIGNLWMLGLHKDRLRMIKIDDTGRWKQDVAGEIRRLEIMLFDMNSLWSGAGYPSAEELERAPTLVGVERDVKMEMCLVGTRIRDGRASLVRTSRIELLGAGWVRTKNSLYKLEAGR